MDQGRWRRQRCGRWREIGCARGARRCCRQRFCCGLRATCKGSDYDDNQPGGFDPKARTFETFPLPIEPAGSETPYALHVDRRDDTVWICGTNSDSLIRLRMAPAGPEFTVYPLPTRVTYTREIDFDAEGRVWTSNSNAPTWQIEGGFPRVLRLDPDPGAASRLAAEVR